MKKSKNELYMYKKNLKKIVLTLCLLLIVPLLTCAQDTLRITVTSDQLQTTALIFAERCSNYAKKNIPAEWDGVRTLTSK